MDDAAEPVVWPKTPVPLSAVPNTPLVPVPVPVMLPESAVPFTEAVKAVRPSPVVELATIPVPLDELALIPAPLDEVARTPVALPVDTAMIAVAPVPLPLVNPLMAVEEPVAVAVMVVPFGVASCRACVELLLWSRKQPPLPVHTVLFRSGVVIALATPAVMSIPAETTAPRVTMRDLFIGDLLFECVDVLPPRSPSPFALPW